MSTSFQLKGSLFTLTVLQLHNDNLGLLASELSQKIKLAPKFFQYAPVVVDLQKIAAQAKDIDFAELSKILREHRLIPVGIRGADDSVYQNAQVAGFAKMMDTQLEEKVEPSLAKGKSKPNAKAAQETKVDAPSVLASKTRLITQPIRSGQQIYVQGGDLIVIAPVSPGAELLADGSIHVYGRLRGRALAGVNGNRQARIFCHSLEAELIAIAGEYKVIEDPKDSRKRGPQQVYLEGERLVIEALNSRQSSSAAMA